MHHHTMCCVSDDCRPSNAQYVALEPAKNFDTIQIAYRRLLEDQVVDHHAAHGAVGATAGELTDA